MPTENPQEGSICANVKNLMEFIRDKTSANMKNSLEALGIFLVKDAKRETLNLGFLLGLIAVYAASFFVRRTQFYRKYDRYGIASDISTDIYIILLFYAKFCYRKRIKLELYSLSVQAAVNVYSFILPVAFHKYYEISWGCVCFLTSFDVAFLALLLVLRSTYSDFGIFNAILGIVADIIKGLTSSKHPFITWVVYGLCVLVIVFKLWLDNVFLEVEEGENSSSGSHQVENPVGRETRDRACHLVVLFQVWNIFVRFGTRELPISYVNTWAPSTYLSVYILNLVMSELMKFLPYSTSSIWWFRFLLKVSLKYNWEGLQTIAESVLAQRREDDTPPATQVINRSISRLLFTIWAIYYIAGLYLIIRNN